MALPIFQRTVVDDEGNIVAGATVTVLRESTGLAANIYSDRAGAAALSNPFTTGSDGLARFYAAPGEYRIQVSGPSTSADWRYQILGGTASTYDVTESTTDTSTGSNGQQKLMRVGYLGVGSPLNQQDYATDIINQFHLTRTSSAFPVNTPNGYMGGSIGFRGAGNDLTQIFTANLSSSGNSLANPELHWRSSVSSPWKELLHTGNTGSIVTEDYEEGTWTPVITSSSGGFSATYSNQSGYYTRMGNLCFYRLFVYMSGITSSSGGALRLSLPFIAGGTLSFAKAVPDLRFVNWDAEKMISASSVEGQANLVINQQESGGANAELNVSSLLNNSQFEVSGFFYIS